MRRGVRVTPLALVLCSVLLAACRARVAVPAALHLPVDTLVVTPRGAWLAMAAPAETTWAWHRPDAEWPEYAWEVSWRPWDTLRTARPRRESFGWFLARKRAAHPRVGSLRALLDAGHVGTAAYYTSCGSYNCWQVDRQAPVRVRLDAGRVVFALGPTLMLRALHDARPERVQVGFYGRPGGPGERDVPVRYEEP